MDDQKNMKSHCFLNISNFDTTGLVLMKQIFLELLN